MAYQQLAHADQLAFADEEYATTLREDTLALAKYGPPELRVDAVDDEECARVDDLLSRANLMQSIDADHAAELRGQAGDVIEETVAAERGRNLSQEAVDRDVSATLKALDEELSMKA